VTAAGSGFASTVAITFTITGAGKITPISSCNTNASGKFSGCTFKVNGAAATYTVTATGSDSSSDKATTSFKVTTPAITVTPGQGPAGSPYKVVGSGFSLSSSAMVEFDSTPQTPTSCSDGTFSGTTITTDSTGAFTCLFPVPSEGAATYHVVGEDTATGVTTATKAFTITVLGLSVSPIQGPVGSSPALTGTGFTVSGNVTVTFAGSPLTFTSCSTGTLATGDRTIVTSTVGKFVCKFAVPSAASGAQTIHATDVSSKLTDSTTFTITNLALQVSLPSGTVGSSVTLTGTGFTEGGNVTVTFAGSPLTFVSCTTGTLTAGTTIAASLAAGKFVCKFTVPSSSEGSQTIQALDVSSGQTATVSFTVDAAVALTPVQGPVGSSAMLTGTGFTSLGSVTVAFASAPLTFGSCSPGTLLPDGTTITATASGGFACTFTVPSSSVGAHTVQATDAGTGQMPTATYTVTTPKITLNPNQGPNGVSVVVSGTGFTPGMTITTGIGPGATMGSCGVPVSGTGAFTCPTTPVTGMTGSYTVTATGSDGGLDNATALFTIKTESLTLAPAQGPSGATITASGNGFTPGKTITFTINGTGSIGSASGCTATGGSFSGCTFTVSGAAGTYTVTATGSDGTFDNATVSYQVTTPTVTLDPIQGPNGVVVGVSGTGFTPGKTISTFSFDGATPAQTCTGQTITGTGAFSCIFTVPSDVASSVPYNVVATGSDGGFDTATASFTITTPTISLVPGDGPVGSTYTVTGSGFNVSSGATVSFNSTIQSPTGGSDCSYSLTVITTNATGGFVCTFAVPTVSAGSYPVMGLDAATDIPTVAMMFTVTPQVTFSPSSGDVGSPVTLEGSGFTANDVVTPFFNLSSSSCTQGMVSVSADGSFTCTITVPASLAGPYAIGAFTEDDALVAAAGMFTVDPPLAAGGVTPPSPGIDDGQSITLMANPTGGASPYSYQWYLGAGSGACAGTALGTGVTQSTGALAVGTFYYCYVVTDNDSNPAPSAWDQVTVNPPLNAGSVTPGSPAIDDGQSITLYTSNVSGGTETLSYQWYSDTSVGAGTDGDACGAGLSVMLGTSSVSQWTGSLSTAGGLYYYCYTVTDSSQADAGAVTVLSAWDIVTVDPALVAPVISVLPTTIDYGQSATLSTTQSFSGGTPPYTCQWFEESPGGSSYSAFGSLFSCIAGDTPTISTGVLTIAGAWSFELQVTDSSTTPLNQTSNAVGVTVDPLPTTTAPAPSFTSGSIDVGQPVTFTTTASSGDGGPYYFTWAESTLDFGCLLASVTDSVTCTPTAGGTYTVSVFATDLNGGNSLTNVSDSFLVYALPSTTTPTPSPPSIDAGQDVTFSTLTTLGSPGTDTYVWATPVGLNCSASTTDSIACSEPKAGDYSISVNVTDSNGGVSATATLGSFIVYEVPVTTSVPGPSVVSTQIDVGQSVTFTTTADNGSGVYTFVWMESNSSFACDITSVTDSITCTPEYNGTYNVSVVATDSNGVSSTTELSANFIVLTQPSTAEPSPSVTSGHLDVGQPVVFTTTASNGSGGYTFVWTESNSHFACDTSSVTDSITCTPTVGGTYTVSVIAIDSNGGSSTLERSATFLVYALPTVTTPSPSVASVDLGQSVTFSTTASSGSTGYTYTWAQSSMDLGCTLGDTPSISCTPTTAGTYTVSVVVSDSNGGVSAAATLETFVVHVIPSITVPSPSATSVDLTQSVTFLIAATGGSGDYTYSWAQSSTDFGCDLASATDSITCTPTAAGAYTVSVYVIDSNGVNSGTEQSVNVVVDALPTTSAPNPSVATGLIDVGQSVTFTTTASGGSGGFTYIWTESSTDMGCTLVNATSVTCVPTTAGAYTVSVYASDSNGGSSTTETSLSYAVNTALAPPVAPTPSATALTVNQGLTVTGTIPSTGTPTYSWQWLVSVNGGAYALATQCAVNSGSGASGGIEETCSISPNALMAGDTYAFELRVTDSATSPTSQTSAATQAVAVTTPSSSSSSLWAYLGIALAAIVVVLLASLLILRRRRVSPAAVEPTEELSLRGPTPPAGGGPPAAAPAYLETPKDVGRAPPVIAPVVAGETAAAGTGSAMSDTESDIAALMAELDKIGSEVVKKPPKTGTTGPDEEQAKEESKSSG
jgi:hypothetical protein